MNKAKLLNNFITKIDNIIKKIISNISWN